MARVDTIEALRRRGLSKKTAEALADAGFTLDSLKTAAPEKLAKYISAKEAKKVLAKLGAPEGPARKREAKAAAEAVPEPEAEAPEPPPKIPEKVPKPSEKEAEILDMLEATGKTLPRQVVWDLVDKTKGLKITRKQLEQVVGKIVERYDGHRIDPNESAGIVSAQSIGEPGTQMSLPYDEKVLVRETGRLRVVPIGEFVDGLMERYPRARERGTEWCDLPREACIEVPSLSQAGKVVWKPLRSVSRHTCRDPLVRLRTRTGRHITATDDHSFVTRRDGRIVPVPGRELRPGARIPVLRRFPVPSARDVLDLGEWLPKDEYWHGGELAKARTLGPAWQAGYGVEYVVPVGMDQLRNQLQGRASFEIGEGFVYPYQNHSRTRLPERLPLDHDVGWLMGAYLAEGWAGRYHVSISNTGASYQERTRAVGRRFGVAFRERDNPRGFALGHDLFLQSSVLSDFLRATCGRGSALKRVPDFAFGANEAFVGALLRAYFDGDGNVSVERRAIRASSRSRDLRDGIALLLSRFGILASLGGGEREHTLWIPGRFARIFRDKIGFESAEKRSLLDRLCDVPGGRYTYDALDMVSGFGTLLHSLAKTLAIPTRTVRNFTNRQRIGRATLARYLALFEAKAGEKGVEVRSELERLRDMLDEDVTWDEIEDVERVDPPSVNVYDFSVPGLETFTTAAGVVTHNTMRTFHYAGVAEMNVTLGLPRLIEIVDARRVPSTPLMEIHLKPKVARDLERVKKIAQEIELTKLEDITDIEADMVHMRVVVYPEPNKMRSRGVRADELREKLKKFTYEEGVKRAVGGETKTVDAYHIESGEPSFKKLQRLVETVRATKVKGIENIRRAIIRKRPEGHVIYTEGSNLAKVLDLDDVDPANTTTNSVEEIYETLGIEAARNAIVKEAHDTLSEQGLTVDIRHIMLVSDMMTNDGDVKAIGRHGISGRKSSVLARAAFEITAHHLLRAAITGEVDSLDGVAENVIVGQPVTLGTGAVNLVYRAPTKAEGAK